jgi:hypothetical protein
MGLEYTEEGRRFVDFDLYSNKKKVSWTELTEGEKKDRKWWAMKFRRETMAELTDFYKNDIIEVERKIEADQATRKGERN